MNVKEKLKSFWEEHGDGIKITSALVGLVGGGVLLGICTKGAYDSYRMSKALKGGDVANGVVTHALRHYANNNGGKVLSGIELDPVKVSDMGELGERILKCRPEAKNFKGTHFIMIGTDK